MELTGPIDGIAGVARRSERLSRGGLVSAVLVGLIGALVIFVTPGFLSIVAQQTGFNDDLLGYVVALDINAMGVTIALSTFALTRIGWRRAACFGLFLVIAGNLLTAMSVSFPAMAAARVIAGAGEGIAVGFAFAALGRASHPDRAFAIYLVVGALFSAALLYGLPAIQQAIAPSTLFVVIAMIVVPVLFTLRWFPDGRAAGTDVGAVGAGGLDRRLAAGALSGVFLFFFAAGAMWSYSERIGMASGLSVSTMATGLSIGTMAGVVGAMLAGMMPRRWGRTGPLLASGMLEVLSFLLFRGEVTPTRFILAAVLLLFGWNFAQPLFSGICAEACHRGRVVCAMGAIQTFGTGLGPAAAAMTLGTDSFATMIYANSAVLALSVVITAATVAAERRRAAALS